MTKLFPLFLLTLLVACKDKTRNASSIQNRDSIMTKYFKVVDSLPYPDTLDPGFKLLRAYHKNDTAYLKKSYNHIADLLKYRDEMLESHFCEEPAALNTLNYEEAYRFSYGAAFCDKSVDMTVGKSSDNIVLDLYLYEFNYEQTECRIINHTTKAVDKKVWKILINGINQSDFWGLKGDNERRGFDGSGLTVTGYQRPKNAFEGRYKKIYRWAAEEMTIGILFKNLLDLSGTKVDCFQTYR
jgi:hypothetical protein